MLQVMAEPLSSAVSLVCWASKQTDKRRAGLENNNPSSGTCKKKKTAISAHRCTSLKRPPTPSLHETNNQQLSTARGCYTKPLRGQAEENRGRGWWGVLVCQRGKRVVCTFEAGRVHLPACAEPALTGS